MDTSTISKTTLAEVYSILTKLKLFKKLPDDLKKHIIENKDQDYFINITPTIPLELQVTEEETLYFLSYLYLKYINKNENEKKYLLNKYANNEREYQEELREKYNPDNLFKKRNKSMMNNENKQDNQIEETSTDIIKYKESFFTKIINKIRRILKFKNKG